MSNNDSELKQKLKDFESTLAQARKVAQYEGSGYEASVLRSLLHKFQDSFKKYLQDDTKPNPSK